MLTVSGTLTLYQGEREIYRSVFTLTAAPGVVGITIPPTVPPEVVTTEETTTHF